MLPRRLEPEVMDDPAEAQAYEAMDHSEPNAAFCDRLIELGAHGRMLDIGTGPGHIPVMLAERVPGARIVAVDYAAAMLELARDRVRGVQLAHQVHLLRGDAKALPVADHSFDTVFSNTILHHLPEPVWLLREAARVLRPGGVLLIRDLMRPVNEAALDHLVSVHAVEADDAQRKMFRDSLYAALQPDELEQLAGQAGLTDIEVVVDTDRHISLQRRRDVA